MAFVTGHEDPDKPGSALDWAALARFPGTLVFYMGVRALPRIAERLQAEGRPPGEPVAVIERGTLPGQRTVVATLADVAARAAAERIRAPAVTVVGPVAALREDLAWLERRPLHGRTVAVTRARAQASPLAARLRELGASGDRGAGDPDRLAPRRPPRPQRLRRPRGDEPERRPRAVRAPARLRPRRAQPRRPPRRGDGARHRAGLRRARDRARHGPRAIGGGGPRRGAGGRPARARPGRPRARRARRADRGAARPRRPRRRARALRDAARAARRRRGGGGRRRRLRHLHLRLDRPPPAQRRRRSRRWPARGWPRSGPPRARSCARTGSRPTSKPTRTRPTGWWRRCSPTWEAEAWRSRSRSCRTTGCATSSSASSMP